MQDKDRSLIGDGQCSFLGTLKGQSGHLPCTPVVSFCALIQGLFSMCVVLSGVLPPWEERGAVSWGSSDFFCSCFCWLLPPNHSFVQVLPNHWLPFHLGCLLELLCVFPRLEVVSISQPSRKILSRTAKWISQGTGYLFILQEDQNALLNALLKGFELGIECITLGHVKL